MQRRAPRLVIAERPARRDHLHGAWWPYSTDIERELAPMLEIAITKLQAVLGVALNRDEWPGAPMVFQPLATSRPTISWYGPNEPHLAVLHCGRQGRIALLVLPPDTAEGVALTAMFMASAPGNCLSTTDTLVKAARSLSTSPSRAKFASTWSAGSTGLPAPRGRFEGDR